MSAEKATHFLKCKHVIGRAVINYTMPCDVIKVMPDGRLKLMVYGERWWRINSYRVRYLPASRVIKKEDARHD